MEEESWRRTLIKEMFLKSEEHVSLKISVNIYLYNPKNLNLSEGLF